ncbi:3-hydroxybutyrate dehydrogenase [Aerococcus urinaehominis]|uniref:3-hydroxybutyrate dehydrogenase n=1 Tax=Aerococcus urinaehominis TaxID=128944 RepID=A0A0X8FK46_9LACT|nr:SDR family NAD(P)-dependent oxidoreductase [Aerococcus urinaehominis]AMB98569.1 3-hydroxybutyrate dehydrogenase [Aerococcus urinaehominis]SDL77625.1 3-hydroxybutyrate dehydrogenase [Aerococcus urinaehominis]
MSRTVIVTGGGQGIGFAIAEKFVAEGDWVAIVDLKEEIAQAAAERLGRAKAYVCDVTDEDQVKATIQAILNDRPSIDVLVNNAGMQYIAPVTDFPYAKFQQVVNVILGGTFLMTKYSLPSMIDQKKGRIITISSGHGRRPDKYKSAYVAAKHAQIGFTNTVAMEYASEGITANCVLPGPTRTQLIENQLADLAHQDGTSEEEALQTHILGNQWLGRLLEPAELAASVYFLASDQAGAITGEALGVTGGE